MFTENKITEFKNKIAALADRPQMSAQALKAYFDSSAEELREAHNALVDALEAFGGASFEDVDYNGADGKLTFTFGDGSTKTIDLPLELLIQSGHYDADAQCIVLVLANGDKLTVPVSDLVDEYEADEKTLHMAASETSRIFSVKDGVFAPEAPADGELYMRKAGEWVPHETVQADEETITTDAVGKLSVKDGVFAHEAPADNKLYGRKNKVWTEIANGLPEITLEQADAVYDGIYKVQDVYVDLSTPETAYLDCMLLCGYDVYSDGYEDIAGVYQVIVRSDGTILRRRNRATGVLFNDDGEKLYITKEQLAAASWEGWTGWESIIPNLSGYATTTYVKNAIDGVSSSNKLKLLKTITLEEDVHSITVDFEKPIDEVAILYNVAFNQAVNDAFITRTDGGAWFMFYRSNMPLKTTPQYFYAHAKEVAERQWETNLSGTFFSDLKGLSTSMTAPHLIVSKRVESVPRYIGNNLQMYALTSGVDMVAGSTIEIWGHEVDENL